MEGADCGRGHGPPAVGAEVGVGRDRRAAGPAAKPARGGRASRVGGGVGAVQAQAVGSPEMQRAKGSHTASLAGMTRSHATPTPQFRQ